MNAKIQRLKTGLDKFSKAGNMVDKLKSTTCFAKLNWRKIILLKSLNSMKHTVMLNLKGKLWRKQIISLQMQNTDFQSCCKLLLGKHWQSWQCNMRRQWRKQHRLELLDRNWIPILKIFQAYTNVSRLCWCQCSLHPKWWCYNCWMKQWRTAK